VAAPAPGGHRPPVTAPAARPRTAREAVRVRAQEAAGAPFLLLRDGAGELAVVALEAARRVTIGRDAGAGVPLPWDARVSRVHAYLEAMDGHWVLVDQGLSLNGTFVNGDKVLAVRRLHDGDVLRIGDTELVFRRPPRGTRHGTTLRAADVPRGGDLSPQQRRVLAELCRPLLLGEGPAPARNAEIARRLFLTETAVKAHLRGIAARLGLDGLGQNEKRLSIAETALRWGLVSERDLGSA